MAAHPAHPRGTLLRLIVLGLLDPSASANVLERGGTVQVSREAPFREWHLYGFILVRDDQAFLDSTNPAVPGQRYTVIDDRGFLGEAQVSSVERVVSQNPGCSEVYYRAVARFTRGARTETQGDLLAVGPAPSPLLGARVIPTQRWRKRIPPLVEGKQLWHVIDLDGVGDPELFMVDFECDGERVVGAGAGRERCLELWSREGKRWGVVARARSPICPSN